MNLHTKRGQVNIVFLGKAILLNHVYVHMHAWGKVRGHPCVKGAIALVTKDVNVELLQKGFRRVRSSRANT